MGQTMMKDTLWAALAAFTLVTPATAGDWKPCTLYEVGHYIYDGLKVESENNFSTETVLTDGESIMHFAFGDPYKTPMIGEFEYVYEEGDEPIYAQRWSFPDGTIVQSEFWTYDGKPESHALFTMRLVCEGDPVPTFESLIARQEEVFDEMRKVLYE